MKAMTKAELARAAGVSRVTFMKWLNDPHLQKKLAPLNIQKNQHILQPSAVQIICEHYVIEID